MKIAKAVAFVVVVLLTAAVGYDYGDVNKDKTTTTQMTQSTASHEATAAPMTQTSDEMRAKTHVEESKIRIILYALALIVTIVTLVTWGLHSLWKNFAANRRSFKSAIAQRVGPVFGIIHPRNGDTVPIRIEGR